MALNITCESYAGALNFAFVGCRDAIPHLQKLAVYSADALVELEHAVAKSRAPRGRAKPAVRSRKSGTPAR
jgi:hypothetical protein